MKIQPTRLLAVGVATITVMLATASQSMATTIPVINGDFSTFYKPGSTSITGVLPNGAYSDNNLGSGAGAGTHFNANLTFSDSSSGTTADIPGWKAQAGATPGGQYDFGIQRNDSVIAAPPGHTTSDNYAYAYIGEANAYFYQDLSATLQADTTYTLSFYLGYRNDQGNDPYSTSQGALYAGGTALSQVTTLTPDFDAPGTWKQWTYTFTAGSATIGAPLQIRLINNTQFAQPQFYGVTLDAVTIPEPSTLLLLVAGLGGLWYARRR